MQPKHEVPERYLPELHDKQLVAKGPLQVSQPVLQARHELSERYLPELHDRQLVELAP
jgi:hypothetical protein